MKSLLIALCVLCAVAAGPAQNRRSPGGPPPDASPGRVEKFKTMRLIEVLKLNEDEAARFTAKQRVHADNLRDLMMERNHLLDSLNEMLSAKSKEQDIAPPTDAVLDIDRKIAGERDRFYGEMRKFLSPEQFARFIIFDRNFNRRVRDALEEMRGQGGRGHFD